MTKADPKPDWLDELDRLEREAKKGVWRMSDYTHHQNLRFVVLLRKHARELIDAVREAEKLRDAIIDVLSTMDDWAAKANLNGMRRDFEIIRDLRNELAKGVQGD